MMQRMQERVVMGVDEERAWKVLASEEGEVMVFEVCNRAKMVPSAVDQAGRDLDRHGLVDLGGEGVERWMRARPAKRHVRVMVLAGVGLA